MLLVSQLARTASHPRRRPPARLPLRPQSLMVALAALWAVFVMPLLALPVDWEGVCTCDSCPFDGGPSCCCRRHPTWANADGTPGKRASVGLPSLESRDRICLEALAPAPARTELGDPGEVSKRTARQLPTAFTRGDFRPYATPGPELLPGLLPRPPPLDRR
ncbi:MAG: hypothetical protein MI919_10395 [Holophagales bacterium]|nr:hypothetical protein [Holophagales bacterium]